MPRIPHATSMDSSLTAGNSSANHVDGAPHAHHTLPWWVTTPVFLSFAAILVVYLLSVL